MTPWSIKRTIELTKWQRNAEYLGLLAYTGNAKGHRLILEVFCEKQPVVFEDYTVRASFLPNESEPEQLITVNGKLSENTVEVDFPAEAYQEGRTGIVVCAEKSGQQIPLYGAVFTVKNASAEVVVDPDDIVLNLTELLAQIETMRSATAAATEATQTANTNEASRVAAETGRVNAETNRVSAEQTRVTNENSRKTAETERVNAEAARVTAENTRVTNENERKTAETNRVNAENARVTAENTRQTNETARVNAEKARVEAENKRVSAETARVEAETARVTEHQNNQKASQDQTNRAQEAADKLSSVGLELETLPPSADPTGSVEQTENKTTFHLGIPASNFAYATFWIDPETRQLMMRIPDGFTSLTFLIQNRRLVVRING